MTNVTFMVRLGGSVLGTWWEAPGSHDRRPHLCDIRSQLQVIQQSSGLPLTFTTGELLRYEKTAASDRAQNSPHLCNLVAIAQSQMPYISQSAS